MYECVYVCVVLIIIRGIRYSLYLRGRKCCYGCPSPSFLQDVCFRYWPMNGVEQYGEFRVSNLELMRHDGFLERIFSVTDSKVRFRCRIL